MSSQVELIESEQVYKGRIFDLRIDTLREQNAEYKREVIVHKGSAVVIPIFPDGSISLVKQYRHAAGKELLEFCAGTLEADESPEIGAIRELEEEIGVKAGKIERLCEFYISPGFLSEKMYLFIAKDLTESRQNLEADEFLSVYRYELAELLEMVRDGRIEDAKTIVGILTLASTNG